MLASTGAEHYKSAVSGIAWPALPSGRGALMMALLYQLEESQWLSPAEIERRQLLSLTQVLEHASRTVPWYRDRPAYAAALEQPLTTDAWSRLPVLTRTDVQEARDGLLSKQIPDDHLPLREVVSSGSTGRPVRATLTAVTNLFWHTITVREQLWNKRDLSAKFGAIRPAAERSIPMEGFASTSWGDSFDGIYETGPCVVLGLQHDIAAQAKWLVAQEPVYLLSLPSNLRALANHFIDTGTKLTSLRETSSYGEALSSDMRTAVRDAWGVSVVDMYSSQELGYIALQCPEAEHYHVQSETVHVEILDESGRRCGPGEVGRVVVSALHNYAMPLLRYEVGDYAEVGEPCGCGRGLPVLARVLGRERNMLTLPTGGRTWPSFPAEVWAHIGEIRQLQLVQRQLDQIEARVVASRPLTPGEEADFMAMVRERLGHPFNVSFTYVADIYRTPSLKFEDFISMVVCV